MTAFIGRREFITLLGGLAVAWPLAARAQQPERMRRIGVLMSTGADGSAGQARITAFLHGLQQFGWTDGRNAKIDTRWGAGNAEQIRKHVAELVAFEPEVILAVGTQTAGPLLEATRVIPIVFVQVADPVGAGFVESLARPGGNATGFATVEARNKAVPDRITSALRMRSCCPVARAAASTSLRSASPSGMFGLTSMSYGSRNADAFRLAGTYAGRILKGERPSELPVMQSTKFELMLNLKTASALGLAVPDRLLALADEVIE